KDPSLQCRIVKPGPFAWPARIAQQRIAEIGNPDQAVTLLQPKRGEMRDQRRRSGNHGGNTALRNQAPGRVDGMRSPRQLLVVWQEPLYPGRQAAPELCLWPMVRS